MTIAVFSVPAHPVEFAYSSGIPPALPLRGATPNYEICSGVGYFGFFPAMNCRSVGLLYPVKK
jgi:hypothetical protein